MRRVSSFWRSGVTKVYSPVISRSLCPAILEASMALPPTCCRHVMFALRKEWGPRAREIATLRRGRLMESVAHTRVPEGLPRRTFLLEDKCLRCGSVLRGFSPYAIQIGRA